MKLKMSLFLLAMGLYIHPSVATNNFYLILGGGCFVIGLALLGWDIIEKL